MKVKVSKEELQNKLCDAVYDYKLCDAVYDLHSKSIDLFGIPDFIELEAEVVEEKTCKCKNLESGGIIETDKQGKCVVCGRDWSYRTFKSEPLKEIEELPDYEVRLAMTSISEQEKVIAKINEMIDAINELRAKKHI